MSSLKSWTTPDIPNSNPSYHASSLQSIRFKFTTENTAIQAGGRLWFTVPVGWSLPSVTDKAGKATVSIVAKNGDPIVDADGEANSPSNSYLRPVMTDAGSEDGSLSTGS